MLLYAPLCVHADLGCWVHGDGCILFSDDIVVYDVIHGDDGDGADEDADDSDDDGDGRDDGSDDDHGCDDDDEGGGHDDDGHDDDDDDEGDGDGGVVDDDDGDGGGDVGNDVDGLCGDVDDAVDSDDGEDGGGGDGRDDMIVTMAVMMRNDGRLDGHENYADDDDGDEDDAMKSLSCIRSVHADELCTVGVDDSTMSLCHNAPVASHLQSWPAYASIA